LIWANDFDGSIKFEDKTFEGMLESLPLHGGHGVTFITYYAKICCSATYSLPETLSQWPLFASLGERSCFSLLPSEVELFKQCVTARGETIASVIVKRVKQVDNEIIMRRYSYDLSVLSLITIGLLDSAFASHPEFALHPTTMISST
jgi:hypothetical protein